MNGTNQQYFDLKQQYPGALLLFKVSAGTLYEFFNDDAHTAGRVLGLTVTARSRCSTEPIPLVSFPAILLEEYLRRLVEAGYRVAVCEQIDKAPAGEPITRVVTPGELVEAPHCHGCKSRISTLDGGKAESGIICTGCGGLFCDNCYDCGKGDGCHCHTAEPQLVGIWVLACNSQRELMKWGLDGDTEFPFPPAQEDEALAQARYVAESDRLLRVHILHVFNNGQVKQFDFEE